MDPLPLDGSSLTIEDVVDVARRNRSVQVKAEAWTRVEASRAIVDDIVKRGEVAYGITTGFGEFAHVTIDPHQVEALQRNLVMSHAVGVGGSLHREVVRAMMLIRVNTLVKGYSGIRRVTVDRLLDMLNADMVPVVPKRGSVGSSGDLAPLAHMVLPLLGMGSIQDDGGARPADEVLAEQGWEPLTLQAKEGLALINGTQMMSAVGALAVHDAAALVLDAQIVSGMSLEALMGSVHPFDPRIHDLRPHPGQKRVAANLRAVTDGSAIVASHEGCGRVQDAYSLRCIPQILGACLDVIENTRRTMEIEINSVNDNPLIFEDGAIISQGNFHGEPLALALDHLAMALSEIGNVAERRIERLVNPDLSEGLKPFLVDAGGLNSGFMIAQYTAASLVSENKISSHPASVDSIPTSAGQEDHNSMGSISANKLWKVLRNTRYVVAIEALCAAQALDFKADDGLEPGAGSRLAHACIRDAVPRLRNDRFLAPDVEALEALLERGAVRDAVRGGGVDLS